MQPLVSKSRLPWLQNWCSIDVLLPMRCSQPQKKNIMAAIRRWIKIQKMKVGSESCRRRRWRWSGCGLVIGDGENQWTVLARNNNQVRVCQTRSNVLLRRTYISDESSVCLSLFTSTWSCFQKLGWSLMSYLKLLSQTYLLSHMMQIFCLSFIRLHTRAISY